MTGAEIIALLTGFFKFFPEIKNLILVLSKSNAEKKAEITKSISDEAESLRTTGRPTWGK
jgi:hypothetical protein